MGAYRGPYGGWRVERWFGKPMEGEAVDQSMQAHGGAIVNIIADIWGSMPGMGHSGAARAGMANLTQTAAFEWAHAGVRVNAVAPKS